MRDVHFPKGRNQFAQQHCFRRRRESGMLDSPEEDDGDYPAENTLDFEFHAEESGSYSPELAYVTSKYSEAAMQKLVENIDEMLLQDDFIAVL